MAALVLKLPMMLSTILILVLIVNPSFLNWRVNRVNPLCRKCVLHPVCEKYYTRKNSKCNAFCTKIYKKLFENLCTTFKKVILAFLAKNQRWNGFISNRTVFQPSNLKKVWILHFRKVHSDGLYRQFRKSVSNICKFRIFN